MKMPQRPVTSWHMASLASFSINMASWASWEHISMNRVSPCASWLDEMMQMNE